MGFIEGLGVFLLTIAIIWFVLNWFLTFVLSPVSARWVSVGLIITSFAWVVFLGIIGEGELGEKTFRRWVAYFLAINLVTMPIIYKLDKVRAMNRDDSDREQSLSSFSFWSERVPEMSLHILSALGGAFGAFASQKIFNHKNKKKDFFKSYCVSAVICFFVFYLAFFVSVPNSVKQWEQWNAEHAEAVERKRNEMQEKSEKSSGYEGYSHDGAAFLNLGAPAAKFSVGENVFVAESSDVGPWYYSKIYQVDGGRYFVELYKSKRALWTIESSMLTDTVKEGNVVTAKNIMTDRLEPAKVLERWDGSSTVRVLFEDGYESNVHLFGVHLEKNQLR